MLYEKVLYVALTGPYKNNIVTQVIGHEQEDQCGEQDLRSLGLHNYHKI